MDKADFDGEVIALCYVGLRCAGPPKLADMLLLLVAALHRAA